MAEGYTERKAELGAFTRALIRARGLKIDEAAELAGWNLRSLQRLLAGHVLPKQRHRWDDLIKTLSTDPTEDLIEADRLWRLASETDTDIEHPADLTITYKKFRAEEAKAAEEWAIVSDAVPGLLQTAEYVRVLAEAMPRGDDPAWVASAVQERTDRQRLLERQPPLRYSVLLTESVVTRTLGHPDMLRDQLRHLTALSRDHPHLSIRLLPHTMPASTLISGTTTIFRTPGKATKAYVDTYLGIQVVTKPHDIEWLQSECIRLSKYAMTKAETITFIESIEIGGLK